MTNKKKALLLTVLSIFLCMILTIGGTYALFTDTKSVGNHLKAGSLKIGLTQTTYQERTLNEQGTLTTGTLTTLNQNLLSGTGATKKLFDVDNAVPDSWYQTTIKVTNNGTIAFKYGVSILWETDSTLAASAELQEKFAKQIQITIYEGQDEKGEQLAQFWLNESGEDDNNVDLGKMYVQGDSYFTVKAAFIDSSDNNSVMEAEVTFDVQVYATQIVE